MSCLKVGNRFNLLWNAPSFLVNGESRHPICIQGGLEVSVVDLCWVCESPEKRVWHPRRVPGGDIEQIFVRAHVCRDQSIFYGGGS